ncbi:PTS sorbitol transporter subunit IIC, partial [Enterococcus faecium]
MTKKECFLVNYIEWFGTNFIGLFEA